MEEIPLTIAQFRAFVLAFAQKHGYSKQLGYAHRSSAEALETFLYGYNHRTWELRPDSDIERVRWSVNEERALVAENDGHGARTEFHLPEWMIHSILCAEAFAFHPDPHSSEVRTSFSYDAGWGRSVASGSRSVDMAWVASNPIAVRDILSVLDWIESGNGPLFVIESKYEIATRRRLHSERSYNWLLPMEHVRVFPAKLWVYQETFSVMREDQNGVLHVITDEQSLKSMCYAAYTKHLDRWE